MLTRSTGSASRYVLAAALASALQQAAAAAPAADAGMLDEVLVTGSYIAGAASNTALPIKVIDEAELLSRGSPSVLEVMRALSASQGTVGESAAQLVFEGGGAVSANLRGLEGGRTLVLFNGRRLPVSPVPLLGVDLNLLPHSAVGRIEVLKDGAAATYGSDAIAGVVNFISKRGYEGLFFDGSYTSIDDTDGDYSGNATWGHQADRYDFLISAGYRHRSELKALNRSFTLPPYDPAAGIGGVSASGSPGAFIIPGPGPAPGVPNVVVDPACESLGGLRLGGIVPQCQLRFTGFQNLVEREEDYSFYGEFNSKLGESIEFHFDGLYAAHDVPEENVSPSLPTIQGPGTSVQQRLGLPVDPSNAPTFIVPLFNPGLAALVPSLTPQQTVTIQTAGIVALNGLLSRPLGAAGNPLFGNGPIERERFFDAYRLSSELNGEWGAVNWDVSATFGENTKRVRSPYILPARLQLALFGLGGSNCLGNTPGMNGCLFFNPFSTGIAANALTGQVNPLRSEGGTFTPATANSREVVDYLFAIRGTDETSNVLVVDSVMNGETNLRLPGGNVAWAFGAQYRRDGLKRESNDLSNPAITPCADSVVDPAATCAVALGPFDFQSGQAELDVDADVYGVFAETSLPLWQSLRAQLAFRFEDYGGNTGSTANPKLALHYTATDWLSIRGSYNSTFRGPVLGQAASPPLTTLQFAPLFNAVRPFDNFGNPDLKPEEADNFNVGVVVKGSAFSVSLDYFDIRLHNKILTEDGPDVLSAFFGSPQNPTNNCGRAGYEGLQARLTFQNSVCSPQSLLRIRANTINGPDEKLKGLDLAASYALRNVPGGGIALGLDATYNLEYKRDTFRIEGIVIPTDGGRDFVGTRGGIQALPEMRGSVFVEYANSKHSLRVTGHYVDGVTDLQEAARDSDGSLDEVASYFTTDVAYRLSLPANAAVTAAVFNVADRDPPRVKLTDFNYDPFFANPAGRAIKVVLSKRFE